jgi:ABC-2 type transport system ATP-binding protein
MSVQQNTTPMLEVSDLNKKFGNVQAINNVSFKAARGEILGFLGPNGAGKSTTMRIISCYIPATNGTVLVDGLDIQKNDFDVRKKIGYLPESTPLYNDMLVHEYLNFVGEVRGMKGARRISRVDDILQMCGLSTMAARQISKLSKGYRQRVGLAQALLTDPQLLILDEPTSGLDPNQIVEIRELIKNMGREKTVIYCSHILSEVAATCNRIIILKQGHIVASGTADELTASLKNQNNYILRIKANNPRILQTKLGEVSGVLAVNLVPSGEWFEVVVTALPDLDLGEQLYKCVFDNTWNLAELRQEIISLEDIFTQLTRG